MRVACRRPINTQYSTQHDAVPGCVDARRGDTALGSLSWAAYSPSYSVPLPAAACTTVRSLALEDWDWISSVLHGKLGVSYRRRTWAAALGMANSDPNWPSRSPPASQVGESCPGDRGAADPGTWGPLEARSSCRSGFEAWLASHTHRDNLESCCCCCCPGPVPWPGPEFHQRRPGQPPRHRPFGLMTG